MQRKVAALSLSLSLAFLAGCQSPRALTSAPGDAGSVTAASVASISLATFRDEVRGLPADAKAEQLANQLERFDLVRFDAWQQADAANTAEDLAVRLRNAVKAEATTLHAAALKSNSYREGMTLLRQAGAVVALYPLSDDSESLREAESLAQAQAAVTTQLGVIRRKRYNLWALGEMQKAQQEIDGSPYPGQFTTDRPEKKERWNQAQHRAVEKMQPIEPTLLEPVAAPFYEQLLQHLGKEKEGSYNKELRGELLQKMVSPAVLRKTMEDF